MEQLGQYYAQQGDGLDQGQQVEGSYDQSQGIGMLPPPSSMYYDEYEQNIAPEGSQNAPYYDEKLASTAFLPEGATVESLTQDFMRDIQSIVQAYSERMTTVEASHQQLLQEMQQAQAKYSNILDSEKQQMDDLIQQFLDYTQRMQTIFQGSGFQARSGT